MNKDNKIKKYWEQSGKGKALLAENAFITDSQRIIIPPEEALVLDVGCGNGDYGLAWAKAGAMVVSYEYDAGRLKTISSKMTENNLRVNLINGDAHLLPFGENIFDFIICRNLIEHVDRPQRLVEEIIRALKPGGKIILSAPNRLSAQQFICDEHYRLPFVSVLPINLADFIVTKLFKYEKNYTVRKIPSFYMIKKWFAPYNVKMEMLQPNADIIKEKFIYPERINRKIIYILVKALKFTRINSFFAEMLSNEKLLQIIGTRFLLCITK